MKSMLSRSTPRAARRVLPRYVGSDGSSSRGLRCCTPARAAMSAATAAIRWRSTVTPPDRRNSAVDVSSVHVNVDGTRLEHARARPCGTASTASRLTTSVIAMSESWPRFRPVKTNSLGDGPCAGCAAQARRAASDASFMRARLGKAMDEVGRLRTALEKRVGGDGARRRPRTGGGFRPIVVCYPTSRPSLLAGSLWTALDVVTG
jgi:hypothetical protein